MNPSFTTITAGNLADRDQVLLEQGQVATIAEIEPRDDGLLILRYAGGGWTVIEKDTPVAVAIEPIQSVGSSTGSPAELDASESAIST